MAENACSVGLILLAAGASTRLGQPKQLLSFRGQSLLRHAGTVALASACQPVMVVLGANASQLRSEIESLPLTIIENSEWELGMGTSIRCAMNELLPSPNIKGVVLMLCDQPFVTSGHIDQLVAEHRKTESPIVASLYEATMGPPAFFSTALFDELRALPPEAGAKKLFNRYRGQITTIDFEAGKFDIDTLDDLQHLR